jgi:hypothetical protein
VLTTKVKQKPDLLARQVLLNNLRHGINGRRLGHFLYLFAPRSECRPTLKNALTRYALVEQAEIVRDGRSMSGIENPRRKSRGLDWGASSHYIGVSAATQKSPT